MTRVLVGLLGAVVALVPAPASGLAGGSTYGDPPGWCTRFSDMWTATVVTNDPSVASNPERDTFYGFHPNPGYDDWFGFFYGDFRGTPGDASGWVKLLHERYPQHYSWNFAANGWAVHGHAKQYIAYYNWTFGGQCGYGRYGAVSPPPYMADQYGWPVVDIYVDAVAPFAPRPRVVATTPTSITFTWDPVADQGDGAGRDFFVAGMGRYTSWVTVDGGAPQQAATTAAPRTITATAAPLHSICVHVKAIDRVGNSTPDEVVCGSPLGRPPMPSWSPITSRVVANPAPVGLVGLDTWLWLQPQPGPMTASETSDGVSYRIVATPTAVEWAFGDGGGASLGAGDGFGDPFPARSTVTHVYQAHDHEGYTVGADVVYDVQWSANVEGTWAGPYPMGTVRLPAEHLAYPVQQAQPELLHLGP